MTEIDIFDDLDASSSYYQDSDDADNPLSSESDNANDGGERKKEKEKEIP